MSERELFEKWFDKEYSNYGNSYKKTYDDKNDLYGSQFVDERYDAYKAGANREGYKLVPVDELKRIARETESYYTCRDIEELIGAVDEST